MIAFRIKSRLGTVMKLDDLKIMSIDELWTLHHEISTLLARKITTERDQLEDRLQQINQRFYTEQKSEVGRARRPYPKVLPKFRNPLHPSETWSGRGKQPRWLAAQLMSGKQIDDFRIGSRGGINRLRPRAALAR
jgi:DNA-binding protein H-NS